MIQNTKLALDDKLPLTCSRRGTCCHGKRVNLNPWELANLAQAKQLTPREFRDQFCLFGGIRLKFDGALGWKDLPACSQYIPNFGCSVHLGRPLACRLYPLGRKRQGDKMDYIYQGTEFPCLEGCPEVIDLPQMTVAEYMEDQQEKSFELAEDEYLELMQNIADVAFTLLLDTGLAKSGDRKTLKLWRKLGNDTPQYVENWLGSKWIDLLMLPDLADCLDNPEVFCTNHYNLIQTEVQELYNTLTKADEISKASGILMGLALHLGRGLGATPKDLVEHWITIAKQNGALG